MTPQPFRIPAQAIAVGGRAPDFQLRDQAGAVFRLYETAPDRAVVLALLPDPPTGAAGEALREVIAAAPAFAQRGADLVIVAPRALPEAMTAGAVRVCVDSLGQVSSAYRGGAAVAPSDLGLLLLDANRRVAALRRGGDPDLVPALLAELADQDRHEDPAGLSAPVLLLPRLFDDDLCDQLIAYWDQGNVFEGTVGSVDREGEYNRVYHDRKRRLDCKVEEVELHRQLEATVGQRIAPELEKAFQFAGFHFERFLVVCYDAARRDFFQPHRDNLSPGTADRRFAVTVNLNDGFEGGELIFPEFGNERYSPARGGAIVFSCSLIHEVLPVSRGKRFTLLNMCREHKTAGRR